LHTQGDPLKYNSYMEARIVEESEKPAWNQFVVQNSLGDVLQTWEWGEVKRSVVWEVIRVGVFDDDKLIGVAQILRRRLLKFFSLLYCPRGPVIDWDQENSLEALQTLAEFIRGKIAKPSDLFLRIESTVEKFSIFNFQFSNKTQNLKPKTQNLNFLPYFKSIQPKHTSVVDLSRTEEEIIASFEKDTRNSVHRAEREGVIVKKSNNPDDWQKFYKLYKETSIRGHFTPRPWSQFEKIFQIMKPAGQADLYLATFNSARGPLTEQEGLVEEKILAGALILKSGTKAYYLWGASSRDYPKKFAPYLLQWEMMRDLKRSGVRLYDLWGIAPTDNPKHAWSGHTLFKKGFGGKTVEYIGCWDLALSLFYRFFRIVDFWRQKFEQPDLIS